MREILHPRFLVLYLLGFLFSVQIATPGFFNAEFLHERGFNDAEVSMTYLAGSIVGVLLFALLPFLLTRIGNRRTAIGTGILMAFTALCLAYAHTSVTPGIYLALFLGGQMIMYTLIDIFIEERIGNNESLTGRVRGIYLTAANAGFIVAPILGSTLIHTSSFVGLYVAIAGLGFFTSLYILRTFRAFADPLYRDSGFRTALHTIHTNKDMRTALVIQSLLRLSYALTLIYTTVYAHAELGLPLTTIGLILSFSLVPFIVIQYPLGLLGDTRFGEREFLAVGFAILACGTIGTGLTFTAFSFALSLFVMNSGAAIVEVMSESYFFKHLKSKNDGEMVAFRMLTPLAYLLGPVFGLLVVSLLPMAYVFILFGFILLAGVPLALSLHDTR